MGRGLSPCTEGCLPAASGEGCLDPVYVRVLRLWDALWVGLCSVLTFGTCPTANNLVL